MHVANKRACGSSQGEGEGKKQKLKKNRHETKRNLLNPVLHGAAKVSMVKLVLHIAAEVLNCMVPPQRDNEHLDKCF